MPLTTITLNETREVLQVSDMVDLINDAANGAPKCLEHRFVKLENLVQHQIDRFKPLCEAEELAEDTYSMLIDLGRSEADLLEALLVNYLYKISDAEVRSKTAVTYKWSWK